MNKLVYGAARALAWFGAFVLVVISLLSVASIIGRAFAFAGLGPVPGDFELVEAGTALAVFSFLPWCHLKRGHAVVDLLWGHYPGGLKSVLTTLTDALMLVLWALLVWRMGVAMLEYRDNGEVTFILQMKVWWGYAASMVPAVIGVLVCVWRLGEDLGVVAPPEGFVAAQGGH